MKKNKRKVVAILVIILLLTIVFTDFNTPSLSDVRNVDILKVFASGILAGVIITLISDIYFEKKESRQV